MSCYFCNIENYIYKIHFKPTSYIYQEVETIKIYITVIKLHMKYSQNTCDVVTRRHEELTEIAQKCKSEIP